MNRSWTIRVNLVACLLLAYGLFRMIALGYVYQHITDIINQSDAAQYSPVLAIGFISKWHDAIISGLLAVTGFFLLVMKRFAGWIITTALFTETVFTMIKNTIWHIEGITEDNLVLLKMLFWGIILMFLICLICLLSGPVRRGYNIQIKQLLLTGALTALFIAYSLLFYP
jgi:hypothetical protein